MASPTQGVRIDPAGFQRRIGHRDRWCGRAGEATVRRLHADGLKVVIADLADDKGHKLADELGEGTVFVNTDVANDDSVAGAIAKASELDTLRYAVITHGGFGGRPERIVGRDGQSAPHRQCAAIRPGWPPSSAPTGGHHSNRSPRGSLLSDHDGRALTAAHCA